MIICRPICRTWKHPTSFGQFCPFEVGRTHFQPFSRLSANIRVFRIFCEFLRALLNSSENPKTSIEMSTQFPKLFCTFLEMSKASRRNMYAGCFRFTVARRIQKSMDPLFSENSRNLPFFRNLYAHLPEVRDRVRRPPIELISRWQRDIRQIQISSCAIDEILRFTMIN